MCVCLIDCLLAHLSFGHEPFVGWPFGANMCPNKTRERKDTCHPFMPPFRPQTLCMFATNRHFRSPKAPVTWIFPGGPVWAMFPPNRVHNKCLMATFASRIADRTRCHRTSASHPRHRINVTGNRVSIALVVRICIAVSRDSHEIPYGIASAALSPHTL